MSWAMPCWRLAWSLPYGAMEVMRAFGHCSRIIRAQYAPGSSHDSNSVCSSSTASGGMFMPRSSWKICHSGCGVPGAERRITCCSEPSGARNRSTAW
jgi:hypothetical protein